MEADGEKVLVILLAEQKYYSKKNLGNPKLRIDLNSLKHLIPTNVKDELVEKFNAGRIQQAKEHSERALEIDIQNHWKENQEPVVYANQNLLTRLYMALSKSTDGILTDIKLIMPSQLSILSVKLVEVLSNFIDFVWKKLSVYFQSEIGPELNFDIEIEKRFVNVITTLNNMQMLDEIINNQLKTNLSPSEMDIFQDKYNNFVKKSDEISNQICQLAASKILEPVLGEFQKVFTESWFKDDEYLERETNNLIKQKFYYANALMPTNHKCMFENFSLFILRYYYVGFLKTNVRFKNMQMRVEYCEKALMEVKSLVSYDDFMRDPALEIDSKTIANIKLLVDSYEKLMTLFKSGDSSLLHYDLKDYSSYFKEFPVQFLETILKNRRDLQSYDIQNLLHGLRFEKPDSYVSNFSITVQRMLN